MLTRRGLITGLGALIATPAIVRATSLDFVPRSRPVTNIRHISVTVPIGVALAIHGHHFVRIDGGPFPGFNGVHEVVWRSKSPDGMSATLNLKPHDLKATIARFSLTDCIDLSVAREPRP